MSHNGSASAWMFFGRVFVRPNQPVTFWPNLIRGRIPVSFPGTTAADAASVDEMSVSHPIFDVREHRGYCPPIRS